MPELRGPVGRRVERIDGGDRAGHHPPHGGPGSQRPTDRGLPDRPLRLVHRARPAGQRVVGTGLGTADRRRTGRHVLVGVGIRPSPPVRHRRRCRRAGPDGRPGGARRTAAVPRPVAGRRRRRVPGRRPGGRRLPGPAPARPDPTGRARPDRSHGGCGSVGLSGHDGRRVCGGSDGGGHGHPRGRTRGGDGWRRRARRIDDDTSPGPEQLVPGRCRRLLRGRPGIGRPAVLVRPPSRTVGHRLGGAEPQPAGLPRPRPGRGRREPGPTRTRRPALPDRPAPPTRTTRWPSPSSDGSSTG